MAIDHVAALRSEADALISAVASAPLTTAVPSCPGWHLGRLGSHVGWLHRWAAVAVQGGGVEPDRSRLPARPDMSDREGMQAWLVDGADGLVDALQAAGSDTPAWNFAGAPPVTGFWSRRQALETAVHRWDAEHAADPAGAPSFEPELASDGIDEYLRVLAPFRLQDSGTVDIGGSLHLHCSDVEGEWTVHTDGGEYRVDLGHAKGDVAVRGPAPQLLLVVYQRVPPTAAGVEVFGDTSVLDRWFNLLTL